MSGPMSNSWLATGSDPGAAQHPLQPSSADVRESNAPGPPDPLLDAGHRLRIVHSYAESFADADRSELRHMASMKRSKQRSKQFFHKIASGISRSGHAPSVSRHRRFASGPDAHALPDVDEDVHDVQATLVSASSSPDPVPQNPQEAAPHASEQTAREPAWKRFFHRRQKPLTRRRVHFNIPLPATELGKQGQPKVIYTSNKVRTTKYTLWSFLPKFLFEQFRRIANVFFLLLIFLQMKVEFTAGNSIPQVAMLPLVFILGITAIKDGIEDYRRHLLDNSVNKAPAMRLGQGWANVNQPSKSGYSLNRFLTFGRSRSHTRISSSSKGEDPIAMERLMPDDSHAMQEERPNHLNTVGNESEAIQNPGSNQPYWTADSDATTTRESMSGGVPGLPSREEEATDMTRPMPSTDRWEEVIWKNIQVGDVLLLHEDDPIPTDMAVLATSDPEGQAFVETQNLDGETNLKPRQALKLTQKMTSLSDLESNMFVIDAEVPQSDLYSFNGVLEFTNSSHSTGESRSAIASVGTDERMHSDAAQIEPISINEMLLRGSTLRNTRWTIGFVLYTGDETKIMLNAGQTPSKRSKIEKETNFNVGFNFVLLFLMCFVCAVAGGIYSGQTDNSRTYYEQNSLYGSTPAANGAILFAYVPDSAWFWSVAQARAYH